MSGLLQAAREDLFSGEFDGCASSFLSLFFYFHVSLPLPLPLPLFIFYFFQRMRVSLKANIAKKLIGGHFRLIVASQYEPFSIVEKLFPYLAGSATIVVYSNYIQVYLRSLKLLQLFVPLHL